MILSIFLNKKREVRVRMFLPPLGADKYLLCGLNITQNYCDDLVEVVEIGLDHHGDGF